MRPPTPRAKFVSRVENARKLAIGAETQRLFRHWPSEGTRMQQEPSQRGGVRSSRLTWGLSRPPVGRRGGKARLPWFLQACRDPEFQLKQTAQPLISSRIDRR